MKVSVENLGPCKKQLRIEIPAAKIDAAVDAVTLEFQREASLPGFRPGKAPKAMIAKRFEASILEEAKKKAMSEGYREAIKEQKLNVLGDPDVEEIQFGRGQDLQFAATVEIAPEFELPAYTGLAIKRETATVTDADVNKAVTMLREQKVEYKTAARELKDGDVVVVNYTGTCEGKPLTDFSPAARGLTEKKNFWINVEKGSFIPGFTEQLVGAKAGDKRTVNVDFPADFVTSQVAGKQGVYEVEVVEVKEKNFPELTDEFAQGYGAENMDKLREGVRADLEGELKHKTETSLRNQAVKALLDKITCELPETAVAAETRNVVYGIVNENQKRGVATELLNEKKEEIYAAASTTAKDRVKSAFLFGKIADKENIKVSNEELAQRISMMAYSYSIPEQKFVKDLQKRDGIREIYHQMINEKVIQFLVDKANVEEVTAPVA